MGIVYIIKNKLDSRKKEYNQEMQEHAAKSLEEGKKCYYNPGVQDGKTLCKMYEDEKKEGVILFLSYTNKGELGLDDYSKCEIESLYIGEGKLCPNKEEVGKCSIQYQMQKCITYAPTIINILDNLDLSLGDDFGDNSYLVINESKEFYNMTMDFVTKKVNGSLKANYSDAHKKYELSEFAQHNKHCRRMFGVCKEDDQRSEFQRDRERIVNSKAFRRLVDKAQIFSAKKGDHYRTRMTHTLEVNQIAKAIASSLSLNLDLTEAIALGHDLGHTPFGHQGERTLKNILSGEELEGMLNVCGIYTQQDFGGFKHNYQSVKVLTSLEEKYVEHDGLDISFQTLEGILKHTRLRGADLEDFIEAEFVDELHVDQNFASSLEGQVVAVADEIAQRGHDIDDAITSGLLTIDELLEALSTNKFSELKCLLLKEKKAIDAKTRLEIDTTELTIARIISCIVSFLINDVVDTSRALMAVNSPSPDGEYNKQLVKFSDEKGKIYCEFLEKIVNKKVIGNAEVACFDYNAATVITKLFSAYYNNPKLLHGGTLRKNYIDQLQHNDERVSLQAIDLANGNLDVVRKEIKCITRNSVGNHGDADYVIFEKRRILVRNIIDYLAGMTDSYAMNEYDKLK